MTLDPETLAQLAALADDLDPLTSLPPGGAWLGPTRPMRALQD